jgi:death on curing protein
MEVTLMLNGYEIDAPVDEQERLVLDVASGIIRRDALTRWLADHVMKVP